MTTSEIIAAARRKALEEDEAIISDVTALLYANQAYIEVYKRVFTNSKIESEVVACSNGVCTLPVTYGRMYSRAKDQDNNEYEEVSIADFNREDNYGLNYTIEEGELKVNSTSATSLTVWFYAEPDALTSGNTPSIDAYFHEVIVYGIVWRMQEDLQDEELSNYYQAKFEEELVRRMGSQSTYEESNQRGGELFSNQRFI